MLPLIFGQAPNITGFGASARYESLNQFDSGAMYRLSKGPTDAPVSGGTTAAYSQGFNANLSKSIYKDGVTTVQPPSAQILIIIKI